MRTSSSIADREWDSFLVLGIWINEPRADWLAHGFYLKTVGRCGASGPEVHTRPDRTIAGWRSDSVDALVP
ncbi:MAG: hypothetical protein JOZ31_07285 [Verrucomicrobia bacterium]|nr:hypothetical protein [Verrucomicrobiota bacterium]